MLASRGDDCGSEVADGRVWPSSTGSITETAKVGSSSESRASGDRSEDGEGEVMSVLGEGDDGGVVASGMGARSWKHDAG